MNEEEKYSEFRKKLRSLPRIHAGKDFEGKLFQRIRLEKENLHSLGKHHRHEEKENWIFNILKQPAFAPALAFASIIIVGLVIYLAFFTGNKQPEVTSQQTPDIQKEYSVSQLETLKSKVGNLETETREFAKREETAPPSPKSRTEVSEHRSDFETKSTDARLEEQKSTEESPLEKTVGPEKMEKKEAPLMGKDKLDKIEEKKEEFDETLGKNIMPSKESGIVPSKGNEENVQQNQPVSQDTTKSSDTGKRKKSKKKDKKSENPPVEQKIQDTITR